MVKNSFTILETLISIVLLSIVIVGFSKNSYYENFNEEYMLLNKIENSFKTKHYDSFYSKNSKKIIVIKNDSSKEELLINEIKYNNGKIKLVKYELP